MNEITAPTLAQCPGSRCVSRPSLQNHGSWIRRGWRRLPKWLRRALYRLLNWTGLPYLVSYGVRYGETHTIHHFAGELPSLRETYLNATETQRQALDARFNRIMDAIVLPTGVRKTTWASRHNVVLQQVLADEACRLEPSGIRVLDVPASSGIASLGSHELLSHHYHVSRYVLGDLSFHVLYDDARGCIFDDAGELLQVRGRHTFFSLYRPHVAGNDLSMLTRLLLLPLELVSSHLRRKYPFHADQAVPIRLLHPAIEARLGAGLATETVNVFERIDGSYDLILSFNLLQQNYFAPAVIARAMENLNAALCEAGLLIMGSPDDDSASAHRVYRKVGGHLVVVRSAGDF